MKRLIASLMTLLVILTLSTAMFVSAAPSVEDDRTPEVIVTPEGYYGIAYIGDEPIYYLEKDDIIVVPYSEVGNASEELENQMKADFDYFSNLENFSQLDTEADLNALAQSINPEKTADDLQVADIFGVEFSSKVKALQADRIVFTLDVEDFKPENTPLTLIFKRLGINIWTLVSDGLLVFNEDGTVTLTISPEGGDFASLKIKEETVDPGEEDPGVKPDDEKPDDEKPADDGDVAHCGKNPHWFNKLCPALCIGWLCACWYIPLIVILLLIFIIYRIAKGKNKKEDTKQDTTKNK